MGKSVVFRYGRSRPAQPKIRPLGEMLQGAGLLSPAQLEVVLQDQKWQRDLRFGDILELRGWVKRDAIEFFAEQWPQLAQAGQEHPIGYYFQQAGLLSDQQIDALLQEQAQSGLRIGALAVLHGWLSQATLDWFLQALAPHESGATAFVKRQQSSQGNRNDQAEQAQSNSSDNPAQPDQPSPFTISPAKASTQSSLDDDIPWTG